MMQLRSSFIALGVILLTPVVGCGPAKFSGEKDARPVKGIVKVDGQPANALQVTMHPLNPDPSNPTISTALCGADGAFEVSTYESGDGAPDGEYVLTFLWGSINPMTMAYGDPDKLNGRYTDPKKSTQKVTIAGKPVDLGTIELSSK
jgi:hypothetical protein